MRWQVGQRQQPPVRISSSNRDRTGVWVRPDRRPSRGSQQATMAAGVGPGGPSRSLVNSVSLPLQFCWLPTVEGCVQLVCWLAAYMGYRMQVAGSLQLCNCFGPEGQVCPAQHSTAMPHWGGCCPHGSHTSGAPSVLHVCSVHVGTAQAGSGGADSGSEKGSWGCLRHGQNHQRVCPLARSPLCHLRKCEWREESS